MISNLQWVLATLFSGCLLGFGDLAVAVGLPRHATLVSRQAANLTNYDFIIVGAGPSGLTVADRLTEDPKINVLVIEAGPFDQGEASVLVPGEFPAFQYFEPNLVSEPQAALDNQTFSASAGRVVGGGSVVNAMIVARGSADDFDAWETLGNNGWGWEDMLPFFIKSEKFTDPTSSFAAASNITYNEAAHGYSGPVQVSYPRFIWPGSGNWWTAALGSGIETSTDPNGGRMTGVFTMSSFLDPNNETRSDARINQYDRVEASRPNYQILTGNLVSQILFNNTQAVGVAYQPSSGGTALQALASKEVIIAAGAIHTPQILQLSGIGPKSLLSQLGIQVLVDLPGVGQNLQDHCVIVIDYNYTNNIVPNQDTLADNATYRAEQLDIYNNYHKGPFTIATGLGTNIASLPLRNTTSSYETIINSIKAQSPDEYLLPGTDRTVAAGFKAQQQIIIEQLEGFTESIGQIHWTTVDGRLQFVRPLSRGYVNINTTDALDSPVFDWRAVSDPVDMDMIMAMFRKHRELFSQPTMSSLGPIELAPFGADLETDDQIEAALREATQPTNGHQCCTAAMMPEKLGGVLDAQLQVYGTKDLRVVGVAAWPMITSGAPTATMYAMGEKLAELLKKKYILS